MDTSTQAELSPLSGAAGEQHLTIQQIAKLWNLHADSVRKLFEHEAGVLVFGHGEKLHKRRYQTLRVPASVAARVHRRITNTNGKVI
jgi:hypothetical protein